MLLKSFLFKQGESMDVLSKRLRHNLKLLVSTRARKAFVCD